MNSTLLPSGTRAACFLPEMGEMEWALGPQRPTLSTGELHLWRMRLPSGEEPGSRGTECPIESEEGRRFYAQCFQREIMQRYTGVSGWDGSFQPLTTSGIPGLRLLMAECEDLALLAVTRDVRRLGLDVERVREDIPIEEMAANFLDVRAQWDLRITWSRQEKAWKFFQFWTSNEACSQLQTTFTHGEARDWRLQRFSPRRDFIAALATHGGVEPEVRCWDWQG